MIITSDINIAIFCRTGWVVISNSIDNNQCSQYRNFCRTGWVVILMGGYPGTRAQGWGQILILISNSNWTFIALNLPKQEDSKAQQNKKQSTKFCVQGHNRGRTPRRTPGG